MKSTEIIAMICNIITLVAFGSLVLEPLWNPTHYTITTSLTFSIGWLSAILGSKIYNSGK